MDPSYAQAYGGRAAVYLSRGEPELAIRDYRKAIELEASPEMLNNLAFVLATHQDARLRDGPEAVRLAERACQLTDYKAADFLDTLAAAYAEIGQFAKAVRTVEKALELASGSGNEKLTKDIRAKLELYKAKRPHRESFRP